MSYHWTNNNNSNNARKLQPWLDPDNTGTTVLPGMKYDGTIVNVQDYSLSTSTFDIYPNPVNGILFVNGGNAEYSYEMYNGVGQKVAEGKVTGNTQINVNGMTKGVYFLRLISGTQVRMNKVVVE